MNISIFSDFRPESFYQGMSEPEGYGAFDQDDEPILTEEDYCQYCCQLPEKCKCYCPTCGELLDFDFDHCVNCFEPIK